MMHWRALIVAGTTMLVAGCTLLVSTDGLSSSDAVSAEGGPNETSAPDVMVVTPRDSGADGDAAPASFSCATLSPAPKFCVDFDNGVTLPALGAINGMPSIDSTVAESKPSSLLAVVDQGSTTRGCSVTHSFNQTPSSVVISYRINIGAYDPARDMELLTLQMASSGVAQTCVVDTSVRGGMWTVDESCENNGTSVYGVAHNSSVGYTLGVWTKVKLSLSLVGARTFTLEIDDKIALTGLELDDRLTARDARLGIGLWYVQVGAGKASVNIDDVVFDYP